ncbi:MAG: tetratricopeptide repeat protein [Ferrovum sp.]|jgi:Flp pilus assembly protein TadD|nr:tetratricopeptide repeat protein [Ferrovum sp.]
MTLRSLVLSFSLALWCEQGVCATGAENTGTGTTPVPVLQTGNDAHPSTSSTPASEAPLPLHVPLALQSLLHDHHPQQALALANRSLEEQPDEGDVLFLKAIALTQLKRKDEAIVILKNLTERFPEMGAPYNNLGALYAAQGQLDDARAILEKGVASQPNYAIAFENLGDVYLALARRSYAQALKLNPNNRTLKLKADKLN